MRSSLDASYEAIITLSRQDHWFDILYDQSFTPLLNELTDYPELLAGG
jgi:hypothetical protein